MCKYARPGALGPPAEGPGPGGWQPRGLAASATGSVTALGEVGGPPAIGNPHEGDNSHGNIINV